MSDSFATAKDLSTRWRNLTDTEIATAEVLLADASDKIRNRVSQAGDDAWRTANARTLTRICCSMVKRSMQQSSTGMPEGVSQSSTTTGPFTDGYTWSNPDGNLYLTAEELRDLGISEGRAFTVGMVGHGND
ncbi:MAG: Gp19/Gp15/Gp42 family protein [Bifidobacterium sp.]|jgi:hypothetical protein